MNKNLIFYLSLTYFGSILLASFVNSNVNMTLAMLALVFLIASCLLLNTEVKIRFNVKHIVLILIFFSIGMFSYFVKNNFEFEKLLALDGQNITIEGVITSYPVNKDKSVMYDVKINKTSIRGVVQKFKAKIYFKDAMNISPYSKFKGKVKCFSPYLKVDTKLKRFYKSKGYAIWFSAYNADDFIWSENNSRLDEIKNSAFNLILHTRRYLKNNLTNCYKNNLGSVMVGMLLGDKSGIDYKVRRDFNLAGISHLLAVSGLHLTILIQAVYSILSSLRFGKKNSVILTVVFILFFVALTGFSPSALRAGIMNIVCLMGVLLNKRADAKNSLGLALIIMLAYNPFLALDLGLQLSFAATLSIIIFNNKIKYYIRKLMLRVKRYNKAKTMNYEDSFKTMTCSRVEKIVCDVTAISISVLILTVPITIIEFGRISILAPVTNVILTPVIPAVLVSIAITGLIGGVPYCSIPYKIFAAISSLGVHIIKGTASIIASLPYSCISVNKRYVHIWLVGSIILFLVNKYFLKNKNMKKYISCFSVIILMVGKISNDLFIMGNVNLQKVSEDTKNYIIADSRTAILVLLQDDEFLLPQVDDAIKNFGVPRLNTVVLGNEVVAENICKVVSVYKPDEVQLSKESFKLISSKKEKIFYKFKIASVDNKFYIEQNFLFGKKKTKISFLDSENVLITNKNGWLKSYCKLTEYNKKGDKNG